MVQRTAYLYSAGITSRPGQTRQGKCVLFTFLTFLVDFIALFRAFFYLILVDLVLDCFRCFSFFFTTFTLWCLHHGGQPCRHEEAPQCQIYIQRKRWENPCYVKAGLLKENDPEHFEILPAGYKLYFDSAIWKRFRCEFCLCCRVQRFLDTLRK